MPIIHCKKIKHEVYGFSFWDTDSIGFGMHSTYEDAERYRSDHRPRHKTTSTPIADAVLKEMRADTVQNAKAEREAARKEADVQKRLRERRPMDEFELDYFCQHLGGFSLNIAKLFDVQVFINSTSRADLRQAQPEGMYPWGTIVEYISPEKDASGKLIGINRRFQPDHDYKSKITGKISTDKKAGRTRGVVIPDESQQFDDLPIAHSRTLIICEGLTGAMAHRQMGFRVIGKPSNTGGSEILTRLLHAEYARSPFDTVLIVGDNDLNEEEKRWPGRDGAIATAYALAAAGINQLGTSNGSNVKILVTFPPAPHKDARDAWSTRNIDSISFGRSLLAHYLEQARPLFALIDQPSTISISTPTPQAIGTDGATASGSSLETSLSTGRKPFEIIPIDPQYRASSNMPARLSVLSSSPASMWCPNPNRSLYQNLFTDQTAIWLHPCRRNDCPVCGERNRDQKSATISHHIGEFVDAGGTELHMLEVRPDDWADVSAALRKKRRRDQDEPSAAVNYFCVSDETRDTYTVVATVKPPSKKILNHRTVLPIDAMIHILEIVEGWRQVKQEFWSSSRGWKLIGNEKPDSDKKWAGWTRVCGIRATVETIVRILNAHDIDRKQRTIALPFWSWRMWIWENTAASEKAVEDILNGELGTSDIDVDALFQTTIANFTHGDSSPVAAIDTGPPPDWN
jgi:hypothetical protein